MNRQQAGILVGRLNAHYPSIAANDLAAQDWVNAVVGLDYEQGCRIVDALISGWSKDRAPRLSDWQETARQQAQHHRIISAADRYAIEEAPADPARVEEMLAELRKRLEDGAGRRRSAVFRGAGQRSGAGTRQGASEGVSRAVSRPPDSL